MKIVSIVGARPQFIKSVYVLRELENHHNVSTIHTGQHYDDELSKIFFEEFRLKKPDYELNVGSGIQGEQTGKMLICIEKVLLKEKPDVVLVYGDTNSTLAGALAAVKLNIKLAHVEAGLRSFDREMPEEINRVLTDHISNILFCPSNTAIKNLKNEGITKNIYNVGDVMFDVLLHSKKIAEKKSTILEKMNLESKQYLVATIHRASNTDNKNKLRDIVESFGEIDDIIVFPAHPRTANYLKKYGLYDKLPPNVKVIKPLGYFDFLKLISNAKKILTDSGGVQKEAYFLKVPCITLRENTEWVETVEAGWNVLVGSDKNMIIKMAQEFEPEGECKAIFGDGAASKKISDIFSSFDFSK